MCEIHFHPQEVPAIQQQQLILQYCVLALQILIIHVYKDNFRTLSSQALFESKYCH